MQLDKIDLNLLRYLDSLLREQNVTHAANRLGITQPAMSNGLRRLRDLFHDPLLVRTSDGMMPTALSIQLQPKVQAILQSVDEVLHLGQNFDAESSSRVFRIMASDYAEATLIPPLMEKLQAEAPNVILDVMNPSDVSFHDVEKGKVDLVINRFETLPQSFHQKSVWIDNFSCLVPNKPDIIEDFTLDKYLALPHVWVSKTGFGVGVGVQPEEVQKLGWVDGTLAELGHKRNIRLFTRNYNVAMRATEQLGLIATLPSLATKLVADNAKVKVVPPPFDIPPVELKMLWSPLLQHDPGHIWLRSTIAGCATVIAKNHSL
ncbi:LysR family transcriptional regulator [Marinomonas mediterranea]|jgi:Transcriptional regulator|uniref:Transcriptional regulator, LysR family n=1 Tax=Marinomonas mediterranea (strain ATCC 700492 / JCM 21426 / NBRC 103028 / MMB-1) TaxID=717774 RepID=F2JVT7_MARM1|nr:LysR family transcriptional regulator [Marinomonas mediterranea]ADZ91723.1 transcriptional regulator, LysR family [Marinomonas mediterranea MMB-1]WCN09683.1 LysR family transcriptional regulator [Marinomonas mediterranea]WCN13764.1 LysR family transcriptional regulator [Marinomonas mediterranea]WCN17819.1 LysR family transcriptional regulator [Marinomonas mediterranea MMB-1]